MGKRRQTMSKNLLIIEPVFLCGDIRNRKECKHYVNDGFDCANHEVGNCNSKEAILESIKGTKKILRYDNE
jgi:hypothetical protein